MKGGTYMNNCVFCNMYKVILKNKSCYAIYDKYPVSEGHMLVIPYKHTYDYFSLNQEEKKDIIDMIDIVKEHLDLNYNPDAYNIGINNGTEAGQTIPHVHVHIIPRYKGDIKDPTGGVRGVIPDKMKY